MVRGCPTREISRLLTLRRPFSVDIVRVTEAVELLLGLAGPVGSCVTTLAPGDLRFMKRLTNFLRRPKSLQGNSICPYRGRHENTCAPQQLSGDRGGSEKSSKATESDRDAIAAARSCKGGEKAAAGAPRLGKVPERNARPKCGLHD